MCSTSAPLPRTDEPPLPYIVIHKEYPINQLHYYLCEGPEEEKEVLKKFMDNLNDWEWDYVCPLDISFSYLTMTRSDALALDRYAKEYERKILTEKEIENIKKVLICPTCRDYYCREWDPSRGCYRPTRRFFDEDYACQCHLFEEEEKERRRIAELLARKEEKLQARLAEKYAP